MMKEAEGDWEEYISNLTGRENVSYRICHECGNYITEIDTYWEIDGQTLCDDCARMMYQRGARAYE